MSDEQKQGITNEARVAAKWWADKLRGGNVEHDNGDVRTSMLISMMKTKGPKFTPEQCDVFEGVLMDLICADFRGYGVIVSVDYHPDRLLSEAAKAADMGDLFTELPFKTHMWVKPNTVTVAEGYHASPIELMGKGDAQLAEDMKQAEMQRAARQLKQALDEYDAEHKK